MRHSSSILSLYSGQSSSPADQTRQPPSYLDFVRAMHEIKPRSESPPPPYSPVKSSAGLMPDRMDLAEYANEKEKSRQPPRPPPLEIVHVQIRPIPTILLTPPSSSPISPGIWSPTTFSPEVVATPAFPLFRTRVLKRRRSPTSQTLRELRQQDSDDQLRERYERQTRMYLNGTIS
jgi:hypothetical protein